jgi:LacI family transcriptional regulator
MANLSQKDIAQLAGVDQSAVSHALRGTGTLSQETRQRILEICSAHRYRPNAHARSLRTADSSLIGVVTGRLNESFHAQLIHALTLELAPRQYHLMLRYCHPQAEHEVRQDQILSLLDRQAAGVVIATYSQDLKAEIQQLVEGGIPLVMLGFSSGTAPSVSCDRFLGGQLVGRHLLEIGCHRPVSLMSPRENIEGSRDKRFGFEQVFTQAGRGVPPCLPHDTQMEPYQSGYQAGLQLLAQESLPDGIFCESDDVALGLMQALLEHDIRIPEQVAIVGFDDTPNARFGPMPLSTVHQPLDNMAKQAIELLFLQMQARPSDDSVENERSSISADDHLQTSAPSQSNLARSHNVILTPQLIIRASSKRG